MMNIFDGIYIGADGCKGGWITCILDHGELYIERHDSMETIIKQYPVFDAFLIDMAAGGMCETIPAEPEKDDNGLFMKLTVPKKNIGIPSDGQKAAVVTGGANGIGS